MAKMSTTEIRDMVTNSIIELLEAGVNPWRKPWRNDGGSALPHNAISGHIYRGVNVPWLWAEQSAKNYPTAQWLTFNQVRKAGGKVIKGSRSTPVIFTKPVTFKDKSNPEQTNTVFLLRVYPVFNIAQTENVKLPAREQPLDLPACYDDDFIVQDVKAFYERNGIRQVWGAQAFYKPLVDEIWLPKPEQFESAEGYAATAYHEAIHWTGHEKRLARVGVTSNCAFGTEMYAFEELVAEIGSAMLCQHQQVSSELPQHASYVKSWLKALKNDNQLIFKASRLAEFAVCSLVPELEREETE